MARAMPLAHGGDANGNGDDLGGGASSHTRGPPAVAVIAPGASPHKSRKPVKPRRFGALTVDPVVRVASARALAARRPGGLA